MPSRLGVGCGYSSRPVLELSELDGTGGSTLQGRGWVDMEPL